MTPFPQVLVVGSIMQDLTFACREFPRPGQTIMGKLNVGQGGKGSNQAIACGRAGVATAFVGATGMGAFAQDVEAFYAREKIHCALATKRGAATGTAVIMIDHAGQNQIVIEPGANALLAFKDVPSALLANATVVIAQLESNLATTVQVLRKARSVKATTILNPAPMREDFDAAVLEFVDILIPNESELVELAYRVLKLPRAVAEKILHEPSFTALHGLCRKFGVPAVIVTLGSRGCFISEASGSHFIPAHTGIAVVDTTGAGDAFCGGFAAGLVRYENRIIEAAHLGTAVAALSITKPGAAAAMPTKRDVKRFLASRTPAKV